MLLEVVYIIMLLGYFVVVVVSFIRLFWFVIYKESILLGCVLMFGSGSIVIRVLVCVMFIGLNVVVV